MDVCLVSRMLADIKCVFYVTLAKVHVVLVQVEQEQHEPMPAC